MLRGTFAEHLQNGLSNQSTEQDFRSFNVPIRVSLCFRTEHSVLLGETAALAIA